MVDVQEIEDREIQSLVIQNFPETPNFVIQTKNHVILVFPTMRIFGYLLTIRQQF